MKEYILSIAGAVMLSAVVSMILPEGKMGKFVKGGLKLVVLVVLVSPFVSFFSGGSFDFSDGGKLKTDGGYLEKSVSLMADADERDVYNLIKENFGVESVVRVEYSSEEFPSRKKISVIVVNFGIYGEDEHIDIIDKITDAVESAYGCETEVS